jgi:hypothetical protein
MVYVYIWVKKRPMRQDIGIKAQHKILLYHLVTGGWKKDDDNYVKAILYKV